MKTAVILVFGSSSLLSVSMLRALYLHPLKETLLCECFQVCNIHPWAQWTELSSPFQNHANWCLNRHLQGVGWNGSLSLSVSFSFSVFLSLLPLSLPWSSPLHSCPLYPENPWLCFQVLSLVSLWCSFVWPTAPASLCRYCGHSGALKPWNTNKPTLPESWALGYLLGF